MKYFCLYSDFVYVDGDDSYEKAIQEFDAIMVEESIELKNGIFFKNENKVREALLRRGWKERYIPIGP